MNTEAMRRMVLNVIHVLFLESHYTPIASYDGQCAKVAFQTIDYTRTAEEFNNMRTKRANKLKTYIFKPKFGEGRLLLLGN